MSLNVNYTSLYQKGIDTSMLKEVSQEILNRAAQKNSQYNNTHVVSNAKPVELGIDLYQGKVDVNLQKQVAINNALQFQLNTETLKSIQFLNSQAAVSHRLEGKIVPAVNEVVTETQKVSENKSQFTQIYTVATSKDREGSNPFYNGELLMNNNSKDDKQQKKQDSLKSIFA